MAENTVNNEENLHSQSSQLEEEDLQKLEADSVPVNTKKQTFWGLKKFTQWLEKLKISCDLHTVSLAELNEILRKCFAQVKRNKKTDLTPRANPKLLTPGTRTPTTDWVRGPPYRPDHGLPLRTPSTEHPENRIKIRNKYFTHGLFVQPILAWICELVPGFIICSAELQIQTSSNNLKTHLP